jgi:pimeloyl-ACP methyl ester carboxylesterase
VSAATAADAALPDPSDLDLRARLLYHGAVAGDYALRTGLASLLSGAMLPGAAFGGMRTEQGRLEFYAQLADAADATAVFAPPPRVHVSVEAGRGPGVPGGRVELLRFDSPYVALQPALRSDYAKHENNAVARAQHWRHEDGARPTLVVVHGFGASPAWFNTAFFSLKAFFAGGWDVLLYTLPFHGARRGRIAPLNGVELFAHGMAHFCEAMIHAIHDLRAFIDHVGETGSTRIGVTGLSLGGYTSALLAAIDARLDFAVPNAAVTWIPPLLDSWFPASVTGAALRRLSGIPADGLAAALAVHSPLTYAPLLAKERLMVVAGLGDRLAPPEQSMLLWEHWQRPELHWFPGSHVIHFGRTAYLEAMRRLMA